MCRAVATLGSWSVRGSGSGRRAGGSTRTIVAAAGNGKAVKFSQAQLASSGNGAAETADVEVEVTYLRDITLKAIKTFGYNDKDAAVLEDVRPPLRVYDRLCGAGGHGVVQLTRGVWPATLSPGDDVRAAAWEQPGHHQGDHQRNCAHAWVCGRPASPSATDTYPTTRLRGREAHTAKQDTPQGHRRLARVGKALGACCGKALGACDGRALGVFVAVGARVAVGACDGRALCACDGGALGPFVSS